MNASFGNGAWRLGARGETVVAPKPTFSELSVASDQVPPALARNSQSRASLAIGEVEISFPANIAGEKLSKLFEAVRSVQ